MSKVRIAIVGVGNCASSLVQGIEYYKDADAAQKVPGLMHVELGGYHVGDVEVVAAFDVDGKKVGKDVAEAIFTEPNNTIRFSDVPPLGVTVERGRTLDGLGHFYRQVVTESDAPEADIVATLREREVDVLVSYLPVGSEQAARFYAQCAIDAGVAFVNALPVFIASDPEWARRFGEAGVPIVGDDIKSQVGATITHRVLAKLLEDRGAELSTAHFTASAIWSSFDFSAPVSWPNATDAVSRSACGATPMTPLPSPVPRPASSDATIVPWFGSSPTGVWPSGVPMPETSVPPTTAPRSSATLPFTPVSITATVTPLPRVVFHAVVNP
jgi:hypothetical protein